MNKPIGNLIQPVEAKLEEPKSTKENILSKIEIEIINPSTKSPISEVRIESVATLSPEKFQENTEALNLVTKLEVQTEPARNVGLGGKRVVRVFKRPRNNTNSFVAVNNNRLRKPGNKLFVNYFKDNLFHCALESQ